MRRFFMWGHCRDSLCGANVEILYVVDQCRDSLCGAHVGNLYVVGGSGGIWENLGDPFGFPKPQRSALGSSCEGPSADFCGFVRPSRINI